MILRRVFRLVGVGWLVSAMSVAWRVNAEAPASAAADFEAVAAVFGKHCLDCHAAQEPEGKLVLESFDALRKGGESGLVFMPGKSSDSLLVKFVEGTVERDGKNKIMPPGKRAKLSSDEIALLKRWIDDGARPPKEPALAIRRELVTPKIQPLVTPRRSIQALAFAPGPKLLAVARYGEVELRSADTRSVVRTLTGHRGSVNALAFSMDGKTLASAAGEPGQFGEVKLWNTADGSLLRTITAHSDALYSVAISPDGATLATGSYDQKIKLWELATGQERHTLAAHNGAIFDLAFRPDGKILASASADRTVKLWNVATGKRVETLSQALKELYAVAFSPDGRRLVTAGIDNRVRLYEISDTAAETTNPLLEAKFAHEAALLNVIFSADGKTLATSAEDQTIKLWNAADLSEKLGLPKQPDVAPGLAFVNDDKALAVGRLDGTLEIYDTTSGKPAPPPVLEVTSIDPRGIQRGTTRAFKIGGKNLKGVTNVASADGKLSGEILDATKPEEFAVRLSAGTELARGPVELLVSGATGTGKVTVHIDDLAAVYEAKGTGNISGVTATLPASFWGAIDTAGDRDEFHFEAHAGETLVLDVAVKGVGSKMANAVLSLLDADGAVLASDSGFDGGDRLVSWRVSADGRYVARVTDQMLGASRDHTYRLSVGVLPFVTGIFPLGARQNSEAGVELIGFNLPADARVKVKTGSTGEMTVPLDPEKFRTERTFKLLVTEVNEVVEAEPNDKAGEAVPISRSSRGHETLTERTNQSLLTSPATSVGFSSGIGPPHTGGPNSLSIPGAVSGRIFSSERGGDVDVFRFEAAVGKTLVLETTAAQRGSPVDTKIEILHPDGTPVERVRLQAVRNSAVTFRGIDSITTDCRVENWEEMELNQYLYLEGEVVKLFRAPQGPDSGFQFYLAAGGKRRAYFDTSATAHALDSPCYIVEPLAPGAKPANNGLPVFTIHYANDDDGERKLGTDSRLLFTAPSNGVYLARLTDTRGLSGERFVYRLAVREAKPDFTVKLNTVNPTVPLGSGQSFSVSVDRIDGFNSEVRVEVSGLPLGFTASNPLVIQAGHGEARGTLFAALDAPKPDGTNATATKLTATAVVNGETVTKDVNNFGTIKLGDKPKLWVTLEPTEASAAAQPAATTGTMARASSEPLELIIAPGQTIPARLKIQRNGHKELVTFFVENLPHGVIVADIGLNGVLIPKEDSEREIFLSAAKWVPEQDRLCHAIEEQAGRQTSRPVLLKVRRSGGSMRADRASVQR